MFLLLKDKSEVSRRLRVQAFQQPNSPAALICLIHKEFNESFRQALERQKWVRWPNFESLRRALATGNFRTNLVALPGGLTPLDQPQPLPTAPRRQVLAAPPTVAGNSPSP